MDRKKKGIKDCLEIIQYVDTVCRNNNINYTLLFQTLVASDEGEFPDWLDKIQIGIFYEQYQLLIDLLKDDLSEIYCITYENDKSFRELYCRIYKKSNILFPKERNRDRRFYDSYIDLYPIYQIANSRREYRKVLRTCRFYQKCICSRATLKGFGFSVKNLILNINKKYYLKYRTEDVVKRAKDYLESVNKKDAKYVYIPGIEKINKYNRETSVYKETEYCHFAGLEVQRIVGYKNCIKACWSIRDINYMKAAGVNLAFQEGMSIMRRVQLSALDNLVEFDRICRKYDIKYIIAAGTLLGAVRHKGFVPWDDDVDVFMLYEEWLKFEQIYAKEIDSERFFVRTQETDVDNNLCFFQIKRNDTVYCKAGRLKYDSHPGIPLDILPYFNSAPNWFLHKIQNRICKFWKTVAWAHMGAQSEKNKCKRKRYEFYQKRFGNKVAAKKFFREASRYQPGKYLTYVYIERNPFRKGSNLRKYFEDLIEIEFEGKFFLAPRDYHELLAYAYSEDYMMLPQSNAQVNRHLPADLDLGNLHAEDV